MSVASPAGRRRVIIPAAGRGNRLRPLTDTTPKPLVELYGKPILRHSVEKLIATGRVSELVIVVGHLGEVVERTVRGWEPPFPVQFVFNPEYAETNSIYSLWLTRRFWGDGFVLLDADIHYEDALLAPLFDVGEDTMVVDRSRGWAEIDMKVDLRGDRVWHLDKQLPPEQSHGEFFGMSYFTPAGARALEEEIAGFIQRDERGVWYEFAIRNLAKRRPIATLPAHHQAWCEIDSAADLALAEARRAR